MTGTGKAHVTLIAGACSQYGKSTKSALIPLVYMQHGVATLNFESVTPVK